MGCLEGPLGDIFGPIVVGGVADTFTLVPQLLNSLAI